MSRLKRKMTALFLAALMVTGLVPSSALQAKVGSAFSVSRLNNQNDDPEGDIPVEDAQVLQAEKYVDTIFAAAPTADKDSYKRELDSTLSDLESLIKTFSIRARFFSQNKIRVLIERKVGKLKFNKHPALPVIT